MSKNKNSPNFEIQHFRFFHDKSWYSITATGWSASSISGSPLPRVFLLVLASLGWFRNLLERSGSTKKQEFIEIRKFDFSIFSWDIWYFLIFFLSHGAVWLLIGLIWGRIHGVWDCDTQKISSGSTKKQEFVEIWNLDFSIFWWEIWHFFDYLRIFSLHSVVWALIGLIWSRMCRIWDGDVQNLR